MHASLWQLKLKTCISSLWDALDLQSYSKPHPSVTQSSLNKTFYGRIWLCCSSTQCRYAPTLQLESFRLISICFSGLGLIHPVARLILKTCALAQIQGEHLQVLGQKLGILCLSHSGHRCLSSLSRRILESLIFIRTLSRSSGFLQSLAVEVKASFSRSTLVKADRCNLLARNLDFHIIGSKALLA